MQCKTKCRLWAKSELTWLPAADEVRPSVLFHFNTKPRPFILKYYSDCIDDPYARICFTMNDYLVFKTFCPRRRVNWCIFL